MSSQSKLRPKHFKDTVYNLCVSYYLHGDALHTQSQHAFECVAMTNALSLKPLLPLCSTNPGNTNTLDHSHIRLN